MVAGGATGPSVDLNTILTVVAGVLTSLQSTTRWVPVQHRQGALELVRLHRPAGMITVMENLPIWGKYTLIWLFYVPTVYHYHLCLNAVEGIEAPFRPRVKMPKLYPGTATLYACLSASQGIVVRPVVELQYLESTFWLASSPGHSHLSILHAERERAWYASAREWRRT